MRSLRAQHLVEPVRDEDEGGARLQRPHAREQDVDLGLLEHRGRLVEQDDEVAASACSSSVSALASSTIWRAAKSSSAVARARVDVELDLGELARGRGVERAPVDQAERA